MSNRKHSAWGALLVALLLACLLVGSSVLAQEQQASGVAGDNNPAIAVVQKTSNSVVGVISSILDWNNQQGEVRIPIAQASGVVIQPGYVLTNSHVVIDGDTFQIALPSGEMVSAELVGTDSSTDLAVLKVDSPELTPVEIGVSGDLLVGSTVIAIGNHGGTVLANTVTSGIVSALERTSVNSLRSSRTTSFIQHDATINNGSSGGGLFNINGELIGINTLKYYGSMFSSAPFEGLGFAIPIDTAYPIAMDLIEHGKVLRPRMGVTVATISGPDQPLANHPPASVCVMSVNDGSPAERAGLVLYDFITEVDGVRVMSLQELTAQLDQHEAGDIVAITVVRYADAQSLFASSQYDGQGDSSYSINPFDGFFGRNNRPSNSRATTNRYETLTFDVTLELLD